MTDDAAVAISLKGRGVLYYLRQVDVVNSGDYVFVGFVVRCVCLSVCAQRYDVIIMTSLRHQRIV